MSFKNVLFISVIDNENEYSQKMKKWSQYTIPKIKNYCKHHQIDLHILTNKHLDKIEITDLYQHHPFFKSLFLSIYAIRRFSKKKMFRCYEKMCFMDIDIDVVNNDENIFDIVNDDGIYAMGEYDSFMFENMKKYIKAYFNVDYEDSMHYLNTGVFCMNRKTAKKISKYIPKNKDWKDFLGNSVEGLMYDQDLLTYLLHLSKTKLNKIDEDRWNCYFKGRTDKSHFLHFMGDEGKEMLLKLSNNEKIPQWKWSNNKNQWIEKKEIHGEEDIQNIN